MLPFAWLLGGFTAPPHPPPPQSGHKGGERRKIKLNWTRIKASVDYSNLIFFFSLEDPSERQIRRLGGKKNKRLESTQEGLSRKDTHTPPITPTPKCNGDSAGCREAQAGAPRVGAPVLPPLAFPFAPAADPAIRHAKKNPERGRLKC